MRPSLSLSSKLRRDFTAFKPAGTAVAAASTDTAVTASAKRGSLSFFMNHNNSSFLHKSTSSAYTPLAPLSSLITAALAPASSAALKGYNSTRSSSNFSNFSSSSREFGSSACSFLSESSFPAASLRHPPYFPDRTVTSGLSPIFEPKSVAVIGATDREGSVGRTLVNNLIIGNKAGGGKYKIYPVNPTKKEILGLKCFTQLSEIEDDVDMAVIVTPAKTCLNVMKDCAAKKVKAAVVISAGFKEIGPEGIALENELIKIARDANIRVVGPNCVGVMNPNYKFNATFASTMGLPGNVAFISQSGAMCTAVLDWSLVEKVGFSAFISVGSMADVNWGDLIDYLGDDPKTDSILIYMETIGNAASFLSAAREASLKKPIVVIKAGKSEQAAQAAASHTGSLAGSYQSFEAAMNRVGVLTVDTIQELFNCALFLSKQPRPKGPNLMIVTNAGGPAVLATDAAVGSGAKIVDIQEQTKEKLNKFLPAAWSHHNPVDILGDASAELYAKTLEVCLQDENADGVLVVLSPQDVTNPTETAELLIKAAQSIKEKSGGKPTKPILAAWMGGESVLEGLRMLNNAGIPTLTNPDDAAATFGKVYQQAAALDQLYASAASGVAGSAAATVKATDEAIQVIKPEERLQCVNIFKKALNEKRHLLTESESKIVLSCYGIPVVQTIVAKNADEVAKAAKQIGGQLFAMKLNSETLSHKSDVGGVKLNLKPDQLKAAFDEIRSSVTALHGAHHFQGVTVQPMVKLDKSLELILGSTCDPQFGPLVMFGAGGTMVEVFKDTALAVPPLTPNLAANLMKKTKIYKALKGAQGKRFEGVDLVQLNQILSRFSTMVCDLAEFVAECDINPLLATKENFVALDARVALHKEAAFDSKRAERRNAVRPYPSEYVSSAQLQVNGRKVVIRPLHSADEERLKHFHRSLSKQAVSKQCLGSGESDVNVRVAKEKLIKQCYADYDRLLTLIATDKEADEMLGLIQIERPPPSHLYSHVATVNMIVSDQVAKSEGLEEILVKKVMEVAKKEDIRVINVPVSPENSLFLDLAKKMGWTCTDVGQIKMCWSKL